MAHLLGNGLISNTQYGFIAGRSTSLQLLHMLDRWTEYLEYGGQIDVMYSDFEKAFDKVPHARLLSKLYSYGISNTVIKWIQDFLTGRRYRVRVKLSYSLWSWVTSGIPQGSVLGPLLFLIFINDLIECCAAHSEIYLFADDAKLFQHILNDSDRQSLQEGINELHEWTQRWLLKLNISKCKVISFGRHVDKFHMYNFTNNDLVTPIERVETITDLGILMDEKLSFKEHIHNKINKAYAMLGLIKRNFTYLTTSSFILLYKNG